MKPIAEQIELIASPEMALARKLAGDLREAEEQVGKHEHRLEKARTTRDEKRKQLGKALVQLRPNWPARGPRAKGWGDFLESISVDDSTARRYMELAGYVEQVSLTDGDVSENLPTYAQLGLDNRPRKTDREREEQPDLPDPDLVADRAAVEEAGRVEVISAGSGIDLRLGDWHQVLADVEMVDAVICDPPYGKQTHESVTTRDDNSNPIGLTPDYDHWTADDVGAFVEHWSPRCRGWMVCLTSDDLISAWRAAFLASERTPFAPIPCVIRGMSHRMQTDGPSSWAVYAMVARPRNLGRFGNMPGAYVGGRVHGSKSGRGKPPWLMENIIHDYTRSGDTVCDPLAGYGETLLAAWKLRRRAIGAELVEPARREAILRFHARKTSGQVDLTTYNPRNEAVEQEAGASSAA